MATLIGLAGEFTGNNTLVRADAAALAGLTNFTLRCLIQPDATMVGATKGWFCVNTPTGSDSTAALALQYLAASGSGVENVIHAKVRTAAGNAFVVSTADKHAAVRQLLHVVFQDGQAPKLYLDGVDVSGTTAVQSGGLVLGTGGIFLGAGPRDPVTGGWVGLVDELAIINGAHSAARVAAEARSWLTPRRFYAMGGENLAGDTNLAPVAPPMEASGTIGVNQDIDVVANGIDPGGGTLTITGTPTADSGTVSVVAGKIRFRPAMSTATISYLLAEPGGKTCQGRVWVSAVAAPTTFPKTPDPQTNPAKIRTVGYTGPGGAALQYSTIAAALAAAVAGDEIRVNDGTWREAITSNKSGSAAGGYIVIKARNHLGATLAGAASPSTDQWSSGNCRPWVLTGSYIWITGFVSANPAQHTPDTNPPPASPDKNYYFNSRRPETAFHLGGNNLRVTNCLIHSPQAIGIPDGANNIDVCYNTFTGQTTPRWNQNNIIYIGHFGETSAGPTNVTIARNKWANDAEATATANDPSEGRYCIYTGNSHLTSTTANVGVNRTIRIWENHVNVNFIGRGFYTKRTYDYRRNYMAVNRGGGTLQCFNLRHGGYSQPNGTLFTNPPLSDSTRGWIEGNNFANGKVIVNDTDHLWLSNRFAKNVEMYYGAQRWRYYQGAWEASPAEGWIQAASRNIFVGCQFHGNLVLGEDEGTNSTSNPLQSKPYRLTAGQGGAIAGVKVYQAGIASTLVPSETNGKLDRRRDWNNGNDYAGDNYTPVLAVLAGTAGYELLSGSGTWTPVPIIQADDLISSGVGCDGGP